MFLNSLDCRHISRTTEEELWTPDFKDFQTLLHVKCILNRFSRKMKTYKATFQNVFYPVEIANIHVLDRSL